MVLGDALDPVAPAASTFTLLQTVQLLASTLNYTRQRGPDSASVTNGSTFDFVIVGGGTAGLVVANRLTEVEDWRVLVVEAGDDPSLVSGIPGLFPFLIRSGEDWGFQNVYEPEYAQGLNNTTNKNTSYLPAGKCLGGSSSIHDLLYERGNPDDYNEWAALGNPGWDWDNCLYYFKKLEGVVDQRILERPTATNHCTNGPWNIQAQKVNSDDLMKLTAGLKKIAELKNAPYFSRTDSKVVTPDLDECRAFEKGTDEYWVCYVKQLASTTYHAVGTCRMAPLSNGGVVDSSLKVYHTSHLRVVDASVFPTQPCSKTCAPVVMVAEKAADIIKLDHGKRVDERRAVGRVTMLTTSTRQRRRVRETASVHFYSEHHVAAYGGVTLDATFGENRRPGPYPIVRL
ncbi:unnamed protein product [Plutella xylostella]|uniref:(diamondback moth) hypothetical protein n=1 Tax=Plutella xylostella TaxID=51655 RepID=A0A8S4FYY6_PLUXY|nr:unnamed protein product [Plutella xylostella]